MSRKPANLLAAALIGAAASLAACNPSTGNATEPAPDTDAPQAAAELPGRTAMLAMACSGCHSDVGEAVVSLDGYSEDQLVTLLTAYKTETDGTTVMHRLMRGYGETDIEAVSAYLADGNAP